MRRLFWVAFGATAGVLVARKLNQAARSLTPEGAADRAATAVSGLTGEVRRFADDVRAAMAEREAELRDALGMTENGPAADVHVPRHLDHTKGT